MFKKNRIERSLINDKLSSKYVSNIYCNSI